MVYDLKVIEKNDSLEKFDNLQLSAHIMFSKYYVHSTRVRFVKKKLRSSCFYEPLFDDDGAILNIQMIISL